MIPFIHAIAVKRWNYWRTSGYKRRVEAMQKKPEVVSSLLDHALNQGILADYVLMDSWFTQAPLIQAITKKGLDVIGMVKPLKQRYEYNGKQLSPERAVPKSQACHGQKGCIRRHSRQAW